MHIFVFFFLFQFHQPFGAKQKLHQQSLFCPIVHYLAPISFTNKTMLNFTSIHNQKLHTTLKLNNLWIHQKDQCKPTGRKAAPRILIKLTSGVDFTNTLQAAFGQFHQQFTHNFFVRNCFAQLFSSYSLAL